MKNDIHPLVKPFIPVVEMLGAILGKDYEIILHDFSRGEPVIVALTGGEMTGRSMDAPMTEFGDFLSKSPEADAIDFLANYPSQSTKGLPLRSGVSMIRDASGKLVGFLTVHQDITRMNMLKDLADYQTRLEPLNFEGFTGEKLLASKDEQAYLDDVRQKFGKPLHFLSSEERKQCIKSLDEAGYFNLKGSVEQLAKETGKSRYTLYADIRAIKKTRKS
ncbi:PAS domain-containing protein [Synergistaceae bacterium OttesenSCG-928-D05]|nr:PAS domain-containing protein [Synergistaceae bacterium OttesenSCG-928-D05]